MTRGVLGVLLLAWLAASVPAAPGEVVVALLTSEREPALERALNEALRAELAEIGAGRIVFREIGDYQDFVTGGAYRQYTFFKGSPVTYVAASRHGAFRPLLKSSYDGRASYTGVIIVNRDSGIRHLNDLIGKRLLFLNYHSASGFLYPRLYLLEHGITTAMFAANPFDVGRVKTPRDLVAAVNAGRWDAGCTYTDALNQYPAERVRVLATLPMPIPADLLFVDEAFSRAHPDFVARFTGVYRDWVNRHDGPRYAMVPATDRDYQDVRRRWARYEAYAVAEQRAAARSPGKVRDAAFVRSLYGRVMLWDRLRPGIGALAALLGVLALWLLARDTAAPWLLRAWLRRRARLAGGPHQVFVSYSSRDRRIAALLVSALEERGVHCWIAPRDVPAGEAYADEIIEAINRSRLMVVVLSAHANASEHVRREVGRAADRRLRMIAFRLADVPPEGALEYYLAETQWVDAFAGPFPAQLRRLLEAVTAHLPATEDGATASGRATPPPRRGR